MTDEIPVREHRVDAGERTRVGDRTRSARFRLWWKDGGKDIVVGPLAIFGCLLSIGLAPFVYATNREQAKSAAATARAAKVSCQRTRALGPQLADYYALDPAFPRAVLAEYRRTIPKTCPK